MQLETDRLIISEFSLDDTAFILEITNSPGWLKYIGDRNILSVEDAQNYLKNDPLTSYETHGFGLSKVSLKDSNHPIGICGFKKRPELDHPDLGFAFLPDFEGKGFVYEASKSLLAWAKSNIEASHILAITLKENHRSISLLTRLGFSSVREYEKGGEVLLKFEIELSKTYQ